MVIEAALGEAALLVGEGADALLIENFGDVPFLPGGVGPETVAALSVAVHEVRRAHSDVPLGINVLRSDGPAALAVAHAAGAGFVRVNVHAGAVVADQGLLQGDAHRSLRLRRALGAEVAIWADVGVKHASPLAPRPRAAEAGDLERRALADALLVTGPETGAAVDPDELEEVRAAVEVPVLAASGVTSATLGDLLARCDGVVVGSALREGGRAGAPLDRERVRRLLAAR